MPQLDKVTFLSQFFYLFLFFLLFYIVILKHFLPQLSRILKFRNKTRGDSVQDTSDKENETIRLSIENLMETSLKQSKQFFTTMRSRTETFLSNYQADAKFHKLLSSNRDYVSLLGSYQTGNNLGIAGLSTSSLSQQDTTHLLEKGEIKLKQSGEKLSPTLIGLFLNKVSQDKRSIITQHQSGMQAIRITNRFEQQSSDKQQSGVATPSLLKQATLNYWNQLPLLGIVAFSELSERNSQQALALLYSSNRIVSQQAMQAGASNSTRKAAKKTGEKKLDNTTKNRKKPSRNK